VVNGRSEVNQDKMYRGEHGGSKVVHYATIPAIEQVVSLVALQNVNEAELGKANEAKKETLVRCRGHVQNKGFRTRTLSRALV